MSIHYLDKDATAVQQLVELFWIAILYLGYPILSIIEWIHWEIYGKGPVKKVR